MEIYKHFFDARSHTKNPIPARIDGKSCWLAHEPAMVVMESASFRAVLRAGPSEMTRRFELGQADQYYCVIGRGVGDKNAISLFSSEERARRLYQEALNRHDQDSRWQRV
jgi:hypothetical protein